MNSCIALNQDSGRGNEKSTSRMHGQNSIQLLEHFRISLQSIARKVTGQSEVQS